MPDDYLSNDGEDWKAKYEEVCDMLAETEGELKEFQVSSKELEDEMQMDVERAEKAREDMQNKLTRAEGDREEWKSKFMSLQSTHTTTVNSLQRELEALRESHRLTKIQLRELEMGNDDLERHERAVVSSLEDLEGKYSRALEEKILLEHELQDKASLEEDMQRLRDELRDALNEAAVLRDQLDTAKAAAAAMPPPSEPSRSEADDAEFASSSTGVPPETLLNVSLPSTPITGPEMSNSDLTDEDQTIMFTPPTVPRSRLDPRLSRGSSGDATITPRSAVIRNTALSPTGSRAPGTGLPRSLTASALGSSTSNSPPSRLQGPSPRRALLTQPHATTSSSSTTAVAFSNSSRPSRLVSSASTNSLVTRSKGMQMVSDMRSRVKVLEQRIQNRVPRMRKVSEQATGGGPGQTSSTSSLRTLGGGGGTATSGNSGPSTMPMSTTASALAKLHERRERERERDKRSSVTTSTSGGDGEESPGWVLITSSNTPVDSASASESASGGRTSRNAAASASTKGISVLARDVASPTPSSSSAGKTSNTGVRKPPSSYRATTGSNAERPKSSSGGERDGSGSGRLGASTSSGLRPLSALNHLRTSIGHDALSAPSHHLDASDNNGGASTSPRALTPNFLPTSSSSSSSLGLGLPDSSSRTNLARSTTTGATGRRSSLAASQYLSFAFGSGSGSGSNNAGAGADLMKSTSTYTRTAKLAGSTSTNAKGSISSTAPRTRPNTMPSRPAIPSMIRSPSPSNTASSLASGTSSSGYAFPSSASQSRGGVASPEPVTPSASAGGGMLAPPRPRSRNALLNSTSGIPMPNFGMSTSTSTNTSGGLNLGGAADALKKSLIGRPTSLGGGK